ncbi:MAG TPA: MerR family transcriptional regulator [Burkholderiaceae bacterium]|nr:MerR family transcriptional regulator [Burkholderiaceae bacterium]
MPETETGRDRSLTIGALAAAAGVGVETVRYYQRRGLVAEPPRARGSVRRYGAAEVARIGFIRRAQELGFTLEEIATLLQLQDGTDRRTIRRIAAARLAQIRVRIADLTRIERALADVLHDCEAHPGAPRCPVVEAIVAAPAAPRPSQARRSR